MTYADELTSWMETARCRDTDISDFFPERGFPATAGKRICGQCPHRQACLQYALEHNEDGIWGGTTRRERRELKRASQPARQAA